MIEFPSRQGDAVGLVWLQRDLRLHDQPALHAAAEQCQRLLIVYCLNEQWQRPTQYGCARIDWQRMRFLRQSLEAIDKQLEPLRQRLLVKVGPVAQTLANLMLKHGVTDLYCNHAPGTEEQRQLALLQDSFDDVRFHVYDGTSLFTRAQLKTCDTALTFTPFREAVEQQQDVATPLSVPTELPKRIASTETEADDPWPAWFSPTQPAFDGVLQGGETVALQRLHAYLWGARKDDFRRYKDTRNRMGDARAVSQLSPYLAQGCLSVRQLWHETLKHEAQLGANESTYWLRFELLWREFFQWQLGVQGGRFFRQTGLGSRKPLTSFYPQYFKAWCAGTTGVPVIDANMRELAQTGFMSNRGRQLVASYLVNELGVDWRAGAAWFESQLSDYDPASNYGNWMYIAGVGHDPRKGRHFNIEAQGQRYDPDGAYVKRYFPELEALPLELVHTPYRYEHMNWPLPIHLSSY